jgi:hypothetical protein
MGRLPRPLVQPKSQDQPGAYHPFSSSRVGRKGRCVTHSDYPKRRAGVCVSTVSGRGDSCRIGRGGGGGGRRFDPYGIDLSRQRDFGRDVEL